MSRQLLIEYLRLCITEGDSEFLSDVSNLLQQHGISVGNFIGQGLHGAAFEMGQDKVIKISIAKDEIAAMNHVNTLKQLQQKNSSALAEIYDVGVLGPIEMSSDRWVHKNGVAFYYVMEKMFPVPPDEVRLANRFLHALIANPKAEKARTFVMRRELKRDGDDPEIADKALRVFHELQSAGIKHRDINAGALMQNAKGEYKLIDMESAQFIS